jgi:hypothetical protein
MESDDIRRKPSRPCGEHRDVIARAVADPGSLQDNEINIICDSVERRASAADAAMSSKLKDLLQKGADKPLCYQVMMDI